MGCQILVDLDNGACFYCSTTGIAFGPIMANRDQAEMFLQWLPSDPRSYVNGELHANYREFINNFVCECGNLKDATEMEMKAFAIAPNGCTCPNNNGAGDCPWCEARIIAEITEQKPGERWVCSRCEKKGKHAKVGL